MHLMVDIETLGIHTFAPIISIGACFFDLENGTINKTFSVNLNVEEQIDSKKRFADGSTIRWWMSQENAAKNVFREDATDTKNGLQMFKIWAERSVAPKNVKVWGNGPTFDMVLLETLFKDYGLKEPWGFRGIRDLRTFKEFVYDGKDLERKGVYHNALDDAIYQAEIVIEGYKRLKNVE